MIEPGLGSARSLQNVRHAIRLLENGFYLGAELIVPAVEVDVGYLVIGEGKGLRSAAVQVFQT